MSTQIAVKLPTEVVARLDVLVAEGAFPSRSHAVRAALEGMLRDRTAEKIDRGFYEGLSRHPETSSELAEAERLAIEAIEDEPWEPWW